jgi:hypothetical protein
VARELSVSYRLSGSTSRALAAGVSPAVVSASSGQLWRLVEYSSVLVEVSRHARAWRVGPGARPDGFGFALPVVQYCRKDEHS